MCGISGIFGVDDAQNLVALTLFAMQHRGQESCGLSVRKNDGNVVTYKNMGLVKSVMTPNILESYCGDISIGHVRYPTAGRSNIINSQPHSIELAEGAHISVCSNGDIINYSYYREKLEKEHGFTFKSHNDGELIGRLVAYHHIYNKMSVEDAIFETQHSLKGAFSAILIYKDSMYAFRDPHAFRPMVIGRIKDTDGVADYENSSRGTVIASETCSFGIIGAEFVREVYPGEIIKLEKSSPLTTVKKSPGKKQYCVFEHIYFSRPDSYSNGELIYDIRKKIGRVLALKDSELGKGSDFVVTPVPDSSNFMALGYAEKRGIPFDMGLLRNHYVGRTFTRPDQKKRDEGVKQKFNPLPDYFNGKKVVLVDDSIVRGTTMRKIVHMIKDAGAAEVHVRIGSPKVVGPCFYGIDTPTRDELIANRKNLQEICSFFGAASLKYLEVTDFEQIFSEPGNFCKACFDNSYIYSPDDFVKTNFPD
ncbi:MAG: amidophosphoribosyltransferase [bacterium]